MIGLACLTMCITLAGIAGVHVRDCVHQRTCMLFVYAVQTRVRCFAHLLLYETRNVTTLLLLLLRC